MTIFRWAMRNGAPILFTVSLVVFLVSFFGQFLMGVTSAEHMSFPDEQGHVPTRIIFFISSVASALSNCATIFAAACIVHILDRRYAPKAGDGQ